MQLVIANKNYSSWSLRPWLLLREFEVAFEEVLFKFDTEAFKTELPKISAAHKVPVWVDEQMTVNESLAICEYLNERYLDGRAWPESLEWRAEARAICCEMVAGFGALRSALPMNCRAERSLEFSPAVQTDIERVQALWTRALSRHSGPWLYQQFSIADAMYAPVVSRFHTYGVPLNEAAQRYVSHWLNHPHLQAWYADARAEPEVVPEDEAGTPR